MNDPVFYYGNRNPDGGGGGGRASGGSSVAAGRQAKGAWKKARSQAKALGITGVKAYGR